MSGDWGKGVGLGGDGQQSSDLARELVGWMVVAGSGGGGRGRDHGGMGGGRVIVEVVLKGSRPATWHTSWWVQGPGVGRRSGGGGGGQERRVSGRPGAQAGGWQGLREVGLLRARWLWWLVVLVTGSGKRLNACT